LRPTSEETKQRKIKDAKREDEEQPSRHLPFCIFNFAFYRASTEAIASRLRDFGGSRHF